MCWIDCWLAFWPMLVALLLVWMLDLVLVHWLLCCAIAHVLDWLLTCLLVYVVGFAITTVNDCNVTHQTCYDSGDNCNVKQTSQSNDCNEKHQTCQTSDDWYCYLPWVELQTSNLLWLGGQPLIVSQSPTALSRPTTCSAVNPRKHIAWNAPMLPLVEAARFGHLFLVDNNNNSMNFCRGRPLIN